MHAWPGSIDADPRSPPVHIRPLVHVGGTANGSGVPPLPPVPPMPASAPPPLHEPVGYPAEIQAWITATSAVVARAPGGGGIGVVLCCMRATHRSAHVPPVGEAPVRSAYVTSE